MDALVERRLMNIFESWSLANTFGFKHECNLFPQGLQCEVVQDLEQGDSMFCKHHFKSCAAGRRSKWMAHARDEYERNSFFRGLHGEVFKDWEEDEAAFHKFNIKLLQQKDESWVVMTIDDYWALEEEKRIFQKPLPPIWRRGNNSAVVDTTFNAQIILQKDEIGSSLSTINHSTLKDRKKISQNTQSAAQTSGRLLSPAQSGLDKNKGTSSHEGNQGKGRSMPSSKDLAADVQQSQPQSSPAAMANPRLRQTTLDGWIKNGKPKYDTRQLAVRLMALKMSECEVSIAIHDRRTDDDVD